MNETNVSDVGLLQWELRLDTIPFILYIFCHFVIMFLSILGNVVVIITAFGSKVEQSPNTVFMGSLGVADLLTGMFALPSTLVVRVVCQPVYLCGVHKADVFYAAFVFCAVSVNHLVALTIDRFIAVTYPLKYPLIMTPRKVKRILCVVWILGVFVGVTPSLGSLNYPKQWVCGTANYQAGTVMSILYSYLQLLPSSVSCCLSFYVRIFTVANKHMKEVSERRRAGMDETKVKRLEAKSRLNATVTSVLVVMAFTVCWFPGSIKNVVEAFVEPSERIQFTYQTTAEYFGFFNSAVNPIIYASRYRKYRVTFHRIMRLLFPLFMKSGNA
ncbi:putative adenosine receptor A3-like [Apostichopus japonicus]|uniref:Putative adenosine receptor A3-like n=1 Tax=Stichopus japonicus TaxID=307972 RepID=A0A2G8LEU6_STIJA|nr:putative adenosine receptor A3-like [Apostichopus japonicus]